MYLDTVERSPALATPGSGEFGLAGNRSTTQKNGTARGKLQAENALCERYLPLAYAIAGRYRDKGIDIEDLRAAGLTGLVRASRKFDSERGVPFGGYAKPWIRGEITALFKHLSRNPAASADALDVAADVPDECRPALGLDLTSLTNKEREVIQARSRGETLRDVGNKLRLSGERIRQIECRATEKLREKRGRIDALACIRDLLRRGGRTERCRRPLLPLRKVTYPVHIYTPTEREAFVASRPDLLVRRLAEVAGTQRWWMERRIGWALQTIDPWGARR
jgi:RNA polymerase sigma factor (sigma-70 family)